LFSSDSPEYFSAGFEKPDLNTPDIRKACCAHPSSNEPELMFGSRK
jgi:hypothetical protein